VEPGKGGRVTTRITPSQKEPSEGGPSKEGAPKE